MPRSLEIHTPDGAMEAHLFTPPGHQGASPPVLLFTDIGGIRRSYMEKAQKIADAGYAVVMPNIYYRSARSPVVPDGQSFRDHMSTLRGYTERLVPDALKHDFAALIDAVDRAPECGSGPIGAVGYCLTGGFPLWLASLHPDRVAAAAGFHSAALAASDNPRAVVEVIPKVKARVYFGHADKDDYLPPDQIAAVDRALASASVHFTTELYGGAMHGWTASDSSAYEAKADALHYKRLFTLFEETLAA